MKLEIESTQIEDKDFPKKNGGGNWFIRSQPILMFKGGSKYPDKGSLTLAFSDDVNKRDSAATMPKGEYEILEQGYYFDKNGDMQLSFKPENLKLISALKQT